MSMGTPPRSARMVRFGASDSTGHEGFEFELALEPLELRRRGRPIDLRLQACQTLALLLQGDGQLVPTETLRRELWGDRHLEWRNSLHQCIRDLRRALSDDARHPRFVATVAKRGYRFVGVQAARAASTSCVPAPVSSRIQRVVRRHSIAFFAGVAAAVILPVSFFIVCGILAS